MNPKMQVRDQLVGILKKLLTGLFVVDALGHHILETGAELERFGRSRYRWCCFRYRDRR